MSFVIVSCEWRNHVSLCANRCRHLARGISIRRLSTTGDNTFRQPLLTTRPKPWYQNTEKQSSSHYFCCVVIITCWSQFISQGNMLHEVIMLCCVMRGNICLHNTDVIYWLTYCHCWRFLDHHCSHWYTILPLGVFSISICCTRQLLQHNDICERRQQVSHPVSRKST